MNNRINLINKITSIILICVIVSTHILSLSVNRAEAKIKTSELSNDSDNNISILDNSILINTDLLNNMYYYYKSLYYNNDVEIKANEYICSGSPIIPIKDIQEEQTELIEEPSYEQESVQEEQTTTVESKQEDNTEIIEETIQEETDSIEEYNISYSEYEIYELAKIIMAEVEDYSQECKVYVGQVILNRVASEQFPNNIHDVIFDGIQFSPTFDGRWERVEPNKECYDAAYAVINSAEPITEAMYFEDCPGESWHSRNLTIVCQIDGMRFYIE